MGGNIIIKSNVLLYIPDEVREHMTRDQRHSFNPNFDDFSYILIKNYFLIILH